ncbi:hypothetical protein YC2023_124360 [Brassica napus]
MMTPSQQQEDEEMLVPHSDLVDGTAQPMEVSETEAAVSTVENQQPAEDPPTLKFTWTVPNFSRQNTRKHYSLVTLLYLVCPVCILIGRHHLDLLVQAHINLPERE